MQRSLSKLEGVIDRLNSVFLGAVEDARTKVVVRHVMVLDIFRLLFRERMHKEILNVTDITDIVKFILDGAQLKVSLAFTNYRVADECKALSKLKVNRVLNMAKGRWGRTILEVEIRGSLAVLKIVNTVLKEVVDESVQTPTEQEVNSFDNIPEHLKLIFVDKYAQGRLYIEGDDSGYSPEVVLMEKMCPTELQQALSRSPEPINVKMGWWANAIEKLIMIHEAGWIHGDCYPSNILWTHDVGVGELKWIDPERMVNLSGKDPKLVAAYKLQEIYHILIHNGFFGSRLEGGMNAFYLVNYGALHERFKEIRKRIPDDNTRNAFLLPDTIMYHNDFRGGVIAGRITPEVMETFKSHPQYQVMDTIDYTGFLKKLTNIYYLENVYAYLILQMNKVLRGDMTISAADLDIPSDTPSVRMGGQPFNPAYNRPVMPVPTPQRVMPAPMPPPVMPAQIPQNVMPAPMPSPAMPAPASRFYPLLMIMGGQQIQVVNQSGEGYSVCASGGGFQLCVIRNGMPDLVPLELILPLLKSGFVHITFNGASLYMMIPDKRHLELGYFSASGGWTRHRVLDLANSPLVL